MQNIILLHNIKTWNSNGKINFRRILSRSQSQTYTYNSILLNNFALRKRLQVLFKKYIYLFQTHENCKTIEAILYNETYVSKTL